MPAESSPFRAVKSLAAATVLAFAVGLSAGAVTIVRQDRYFLADQTTKGPDATADWFLQSAGMGTSEEFLRGIARAQLPRDADVAYVAPVSGSSGPDFWQTYYIASYLLSPRAVSVIAWCEGPAAAATRCELFSAVTDLAATVAASGAHHVLVAGDHEVPLDRVRAHRISHRLTLLDLQ